jgi:DNA uptake protein ComE-like DNA-binding protein
VGDDKATSISEMAAEAESLAAGSTAASEQDPELEPPAWVAGEAQPAAGDGWSALPEAGVSLNGADLEQLHELGMSPTQARRVLNYREQRDGFESVDELDDLPGFPPELLAEIKRRLVP